jgi:uncharacterized membrane protein
MMWSSTDWVLVSLGLLLFWTIDVAGVLWLIASVRRPNPSDTASSQPGSVRGAPGKDARAILDERLARGGLTIEEYQTRRDLLAHR